jgi:myo-inositol-1(or 4)-monophosphatase
MNSSQRPGHAPPAAADAQLVELESICVAAAEAGARVLRELFERPREVRLKGRIDLVTDADRAAEERILLLLGERAPGVAILAEESGAHGDGAARARFVVDPLDGTTNYAHGIPLFACTVAAELKGVVVAGCTVDPIRGDRFKAHRGGGAWLGRAGLDRPGAHRPSSEPPERRLAVSATDQLAHAVVCTGFPAERRARLDEALAAFGLFTEQARGTRRLGSAALDLAYVAAGRLDLFYEQGLKPWDIAAGQVLVEEAGGVVTMFDGAPLQLAGGELFAAGPLLAPLGRALLAEARSRTSPPTP